MSEAQTTEDEGSTEIELETCDLTELRIAIEAMITNLRGPAGKPASRATALAVTKLQEAKFWLGEALFGEEGNG